MPSQTLADDDRPRRPHRATVKPKQTVKPDPDQRAKPEPKRHSPAWEKAREERNAKREAAGRGRKNRRTADR